jgi:hypothetical protein
MKKKTLILICLFSGIAFYAFGQKKKPPMGKFVAESQFKDFIPVSPMEFEQTVVIYDKTKKQFDTLSIKELSANSDLCRQFLPNETVYATVKKIDNSAEASFGPATLSGEQGSYTITMDYGKFTTLKILNGTTCAGFAKVGIGMRVTAQITTFKAGVDISSLFGLGLAAKTNQLRGQLSIDVIGMESGKITDLITLPVDISEASIQTALQSMSAIKSKIYEDDTRLYPQILAVKRANQYGDCSVFDILNTLEVPEITAKEKGFNDGRAMRTLVDSIKGFYQNNGKYPNSLDEVNAQAAISTLKKERLDYRLDSERGFILRFAGEDTQLNTPDDRLYYGN